jgi:hypothetical protein
MGYTIISPNEMGVLEKAKRIQGEILSTKELFEEIFLM